jgi:phage-related protein
LDSLESSQQVKVLRLIQNIEIYGINSVLPHTKKLSGSRLWELSILGKDNLRLIYIIPVTDSVLILHGFNKKTRKTNPKDIAIALKRYSDWKSHH